jgi:cytochrome b561
MLQQLKSFKFWVGLLLICTSIYVYYLGHTIHTIDPKVDRTAFIAAIWKHVGYATLLFVPIVIYLIVRKKENVAQEIGPWSRWVIRLFQITFILKMITGPLTVWARGSTWKVFDWFGIPSPVERMDGPYEFLEKAHSLLNYPIVILFIGLVFVTFRSTVMPSRQTSDS